MNIIPEKKLIESIYNNILQPINATEWKETINNLSNGKASGPSSMTYDDIKLAPKEFNDILKTIVNEIFETQVIPADWKKANIYPIPKPKPWGFQLINTRPITLLEPARKLMMKIITNRLSKIIQEKNVLQGFQFAGLPLASTFEPLRIVNKIIQHANE